MLNIRCPDYCSVEVAQKVRCKRFAANLLRILILEFDQSKAHDSK